MPDNGQALTAAERAAVLVVINTGDYADLAVGQIWARELDEGRYLCSMSSMYRIARDAGQTRGRRRQATYPAKVKPELMAEAPSQIWSWDITKLRGPSKGVFYHLYVLIDIFSRYNPGWLVSTCEESNLAADFIADAITRNGAAPHSVHADRGTSMTSKPVSMLLTDLGVTRSHSRPHVSNDNPFSPGAVPDSEIPAGLSRSFRIVGTREAVLHQILLPVQLHPPAFRHRLAHPSVRSLRHRRRHRRRPPSHPHRSVPRQPSTVRQTTPPTDPARKGLDQPTPTSPTRINSHPMSHLT